MILRHRIATIVFALACAFVLSLEVPARAQPVSDEAKELQGDWEISNADRDKLCTLTLIPERTPQGLKIQFDAACAEAFEITKNVAAWRLDKDGMHFVDARGQVLIDLDEVEKGIFEGMRPGEGRYFLQSLAAVRQEAKPEQVFGEWQVSRGTDEPICTIIFSDKTTAGNFSLELKPGCGQLVTAFAPTSWKMEQGEVVIYSARGSWRFEEAGEIAWRRIPEGREPLWLVRPTDAQPPPEGGG